MSWWAKARLRTKIFVAFAALIIGILATTSGFIQLVVRQEAERTLSRELLTTGQVFQRLLQERAIRLRTNSVLLASDFALKRILATHFNPTRYDPATLASAAVSYQRRIGVELLWLTDETGVLLAALPSRSPIGRSVGGMAPLARALETGEAASTVAEIDGSLYQLTGLPVLGPDIIGFLLIGHVIDDHLAAQLKKDTGTDISFLTETHVFASSWPQNRLDQLLPAGPERAASLHRAASGKPFLLTLGGERFLLLPVAVDGDFPQPLYALVQASYEPAIAPLRALQLRIAAIGTLATAIALLIGIGLAGGIIRPVGKLVAGMREVLKGNLHYRSRIDRQDEIGFLARSFDEMVDALEDREHIKNTFGRFVSREVADAVLAGRIPLEGERREVSILFQDIRGFTGLSQKLQPIELLRVLNQFFTQVVAAVELNGGVVKQFTGDGVMALFGAPQDRPDHAERAVRAALDIVRRLEGLNVLLQEQGIAPLVIGIGVHSGEVVAGLIGPDERVEYGVVGEPVNLASRVESATKEVPATILVSSEIAARLNCSEFELGQPRLLPVKGRLQPMEVLEVLTVSTG